MGKEEKVAEHTAELLPRDELEAVVAIGKLVFPGATIEAHETKSRIRHNLKFNEGHGIHTTSFDNSLYSCDWWVFLSEFVYRKLPKSIADGFSGENISEPIYYLTEKLGL